MTETSTTHLSDAVRDALDLSDAHRIALIDRDLWIGYGRARDAHARLERVLRSERRMRPDNLLVVGASNNGKTAIARRFLARHGLAENPDAERSRIETTLV
jgi:DNA helicase TIP49 (TBP-interacting protein)